ncbi:MAG: RdgB/HAM1 family non-canonical purine NTP pyrophosphatase [Flavobacteriales bacterium]|jgi:XTP/dITP diphosphohydrolase|nr:RdgB/HAM1 family non-canonical purine NTP pyrophosphatase [Flavobacteriales bacterium]
MRRLVLCTGNQGKVAELKALLPATFELLGATTVGLPTELPETGTTLEANAMEKARYAFDRCGLPCIADDTGLEVDALGGAPGVYSARYAGPQRDPKANMARLLMELEGKERAARFRTVIALIDEQGALTVEGVVRGSIAGAPRGRGGFGYDPVFVPEGWDRSFAEMDLAAKNAISHRRRAVDALVAKLATRYR